MKEKFTYKILLAEKRVIRLNEKGERVGSLEFHDMPGYIGPDEEEMYHCYRVAWDEMLELGLRT